MMGTLIQYIPPLITVWVVALISGVTVNACTFYKSVRRYLNVRKSERPHAYRLTAWNSVEAEATTLIELSGVLALRIWTLSWPLPISAQFASHWMAEATIMTALQMLWPIRCVRNLRNQHRVMRELAEQDERCMES